MSLAILAAITFNGRGLRDLSPASMYNLRQFDLPGQATGFHSPVSAS